MHIDMPTRHDLERLAAARDPHSVTVYLPTSSVPADSEENQTRARSLFGSAVELLRTRGHKDAAAAVESFLQELLETPEFWFDMGRSLAVFATPTSVVEFRLPNGLEDHVSVTDRFAITPLLRAITFPNAALVLAISQGGARLIEVSADRPAEEIAVPGMPADAASAVGLDSIGGRAPSGRLQGDEGRKVRLTQYARSVDHVLRPILNGQSLPLVIAAAEPLRSIYRNLAGYAHVASEVIEGNPDELTPAQLEQSARGVLDRIYAADLAALHETYAERRSNGRGSADLSDLARAAAFGAVDTLAVDMDAAVGGTVGDDGSLSLDGDADQDVIEEITRRALGAGARVLALRRSDMPDNAQAAGILRYAV
ncbi:baeRF11 domain-containing protein [Pseudarthrobacter sp. 1C304]|uniref:baeRF11 domain-containing protein n=1 Tax=Pseudarthrobacter sp. 1C304 TaxID=3457438 RepID=UPI003FD611B8